MAKVTNPLHSLNASGTVGKLAAFRSTAAGSVCAMKPDSYRQASAAQLENQQMMIDARAAFLTLSPADLGHWNARAAAIHNTAWPTFFAEYQCQQIVAPNMPLIPEPTLR